MTISFSHRSSASPSHVSTAILGGGPAGLAVGYHLGRRSSSFRIFEASDQVGGNARTLEHRANGEAYRFDTGAHRLHDRDEEVTVHIRSLLGDDLALVEAPSQIFQEGVFLDFPLSPLDLLSKLGPRAFQRAVVQIVGNRWISRFRRDPSEPSAGPSFQNLAVDRYGREIASRFLLNYSQKLWGLPCEQLSAAVAGKRLNGLTLKSFLREALFGQRSKTRHLEGSRFLYPRGGIGALIEALERSCPASRISTGARVKEIHHASGRVQSIEITPGRRVFVESVVSTLPLPVLIASLRPRPPSGIQALAQSLEFRQLVLCLFVIDRPSVNRCATLYFPEAEIPFTRVYEPRNRCVEMSPPGKTSLVVEVPCALNDKVWTSDDAAVQEFLLDSLVATGLIERSDVLDSRIERLRNAYPVLELGYEQKVQALEDYLAGFENLHLTGRNGLFRYSHLHDLMAWGQLTAETISIEESRRELLQGGLMAFSSPREALN